MYQQEREDERVCRSLQVSRRRRAVLAAGVTALMSKEAGSAQVYASAFLLVMPLLAMFFLQASAAGRGRPCMAAFELYVKEAMVKDELTMVFRVPGTCTTSRSAWQLSLLPCSVRQCFAPCSVLAQDAEHGRSRARRRRVAQCPATVRVVATCASPG